MKNADKIIIYDDSCPMCNWYTGAFVKTGLLQKNGRQAFTNIDPQLLQLIDINTCRNEIPLINTANKTVLYGTDALIDVVGSKFPFIKTVGTIPFLRRLLKVLYKLISYNRRTIVAPTIANKGFDCTPDFNVKYRFAFILIGFLATIAFLFPLQKNVFALSILKRATILQIQIAFLLFITSSIAITAFLKKQMAIEFVGQINMLAIIGMLLSLPLILLNKIGIMPQMLNNIGLLAICLVILKEYFRRMKFANLLSTHKSLVAVQLVSISLIIIYLIK